MAGHSKWANRKHRKARQDAKRAKIFTKITKEIIMAAREGGGDPEVNMRLRLAIQKAKENNMPNDNIDRAIKKGTGELEGVTYEEFVYEGYGPGGVAIMIEIATDNRNRTAADMRYIFSRHNGNLGQSGSVAWMFERKGLVYIDRQEHDYDEDELLMAALEAGALDLKVEDDSFEIYTSVEDFSDVTAYLNDNGFAYTSAELAYVPKNTVTVEGETALSVLKLIEALEDHDDVQNVYSNADISDEEMAKLEQDQ